MPSGGGSCARATPQTSGSIAFWATSLPLPGAPRDGPEATAALLGGALSELEAGEVHFQRLWLAYMWGRAAAAGVEAAAARVAAAAGGSGEGGGGGW